MFIVYVDYDKALMCLGGVALEGGLNGGGGIFFRLDTLKIVYPMLPNPALIKSAWCIH